VLRKASLDLAFLSPLNSMESERENGSFCFCRQCSGTLIAGAIMAGFAAHFFDEVNAFDADAALDRLDHVVNRQTRPPRPRSALPSRRRSGR